MRKPFIFNSILGLVSKKGPIDNTDVERIAARGKEFHRRQSPALVDVAVAISRSRRSALFVWNRADTKQFAEGLIANHGSTSAALNGYFAGGKQLIDILPALTSRGAAEIGSKQGGVFTVFALDLERDVITACNTLHGTRPTLYANGTDAGVLGTSVTFVSWVANGFSYPGYNLPAIADYLLNEQHSTYNTPFLGTHVLPVNSVITADETGLRCRPLDDALKTLCLSDASPTPSYFDDLTESLVNSARSFADGTHYALGLTGGRDSRLLLSGLAAAGVDVSVQVNGFPEDADVILAKRIAEVMRVPLTYYETYAGQSSFSTVEVQQYLWKYLRDTDGMSMNRPTQPSDYRRHFFLNEAPNPAERYENYEGSMFSGLAGEMWRGGSFLIPSRSFLEGKTWLQKDEAARLLSTFGKPPYSFFLKPEFKPQFEEFFSNWVRKNMDPSNYMRIFELIPIVHYYGMNHNFIDDIILLADNKVTRKIQDVGLQHRMLERLPFEVIARLAPQLRDVPLENTRWAFERDKPLPGREDGWQSRHPVPHAAQHASNYAYYMVGVSDSMRRATHEMIFDSPGSELLFEIVDRQAVEHIFDSPDLFYSRWSWGIWNLCQGALVLSGALIPETPRPAERVVEVRLDAPWAQAAFDICAALNRLDLQYPPSQSTRRQRLRSWWEWLLLEARQELRRTRSERPGGHPAWLYLAASVRLGLKLLGRTPSSLREMLAQHRRASSGSPDKLVLLALARSLVEAAITLIKTSNGISTSLWQQYVASLKLEPPVEFGEVRYTTFGTLPGLDPKAPPTFATKAEITPVLREVTAAVRRGMGVTRFEILQA